MCCFIPQMKTTFLCQLNTVAGFLVMLLLFTVYFTLRFINVFSRQCNYLTLANSTYDQYLELKKARDFSNFIVKEYEISLPLVECCDKYFEGIVWKVVYIVMFILCLFVLFTFCYLNDKVLLFAIGLFMLACFVNLILQIVSLVGPIVLEVRNKEVCYIENAVLIFGYLYMIIVLNSYFYIVDDINS